MIRQEAYQLEKFLKELTGDDYHIPDNRKQTPKDSVVLYNPRFSLHSLFRAFELFGQQTRRINNVVEKMLYKESFQKENRLQYPYFFQVSTPGLCVPLSEKTIRNVNGLTYEFENGPQEQTMTAVEAILYHLFYQFKGEAQPFPCQIVTLTVTSLNIPLVIGFDEEEICNSIQLFNALKLQSVGTKKIIDVY